MALTLQDIENGIAKLFYRRNEKVDKIIQLIHSERRKRNRFLVLTMSLTMPLKIELYLLKQVEARSCDEYIISSLGTSKSLLYVDFLDPGNNALEVGMEPSNSKPLKFVTLHGASKSVFIEHLRRLLNTYQPHILEKVAFRHLPAELPSQSSTSNGKDGDSESTNGGDSPDKAQLQEQSSKTSKLVVQSLTEKEERDLDLFLGQTNNAMSDASAVVENLRRRLQEIDGENVHAIMTSEEQVVALMHTLDTSLEELNALDTRMQRYEAHLVDVEETMSSLTNRDALLQLSSENRRKLLVALQSTLAHLTLDEEHWATLERADLESERGIRACTEAALALQSLLHAHLPDGLGCLDVTRECFDRLGGLCDRFAQTLASQINNICVRKKMEAEGLAHRTSSRLDVNSTGQGGGAVSNYLLQVHQTRWQELSRYTRLVHWYREVKPRDFTLLMQNYVTYTRPLYDKEITMLIGNIRNFATQGRDKKGGMMNAASVSNLSSTTSRYGGSNSSVNRISSGSGSSATPQKGRCDSNTSGGGGGGHIDAEMSHVGEGSVFHKRFAYFIQRLKHMMLDEERFYEDFFSLVKENKAERLPCFQGLFPTVQDEVIRTIEMLDSCQSGPLETLMAASSAGGGGGGTDKSGSGSSALIPVIFSMDMLVIVSRENDESLKGSQCVPSVWWHWQVSVKRSFDSLVEKYKHAFVNFQASKKTARGVLPIVRDYEKFTECANIAFKDGQRQSDLEKAHMSMLEDLYATIGRVSLERQGQKMPAEVVIIANYNRLKSILWSLKKMESLSSHRHDVTQRYEQALNKYVTDSVGCPFEKMHSFFLEIDEAIKAGVKQDAIEFQIRFNKQALKKVLDEYPLKEVKRGLESLCKRVEKHFSRESGLFDVAWTRIQVEFMRQRERYAQSLERCYRDKNLQLPFTARDLEAVFKDIAKKG